MVAGMQLLDRTKCVTLTTWRDGRRYTAARQDEVCHTHHMVGEMVAGIQLLDRTRCVTLTT